MHIFFLNPVIQTIGNLLLSKIAKYSWSRSSVLKILSSEFSIECYLVLPLFHFAWFLRNQIKHSQEVDTYAAVKTLRNFMIIMANKCLSLTIDPTPLLEVDESDLVAWIKEYEPIHRAHETVLL